MDRQKDIEVFGLISLVGLVSGLLFPKALNVSLDRGIALWVACCVACGLVQTANSFGLRLRFSLAASSIAALSMLAAVIGFIIVRWIINRLQDPEATLIFIPVGSGALTDPLEPLAMMLIAILLLITFTSSFVVTLLSAVASQLLIAAGQSLFQFGSEGLKKVGRLMAGIVAVIAGAFAVWSAFG